MSSLQIINFISSHWLLTTAFVVTIVALVINEARSKSGNIALSSEQLVHTINHDNAVVLDLRAADIFATGSIVGSLNVVELDSELKKLKKYQTKPVVLVDANGQSVHRAVRILSENNFANVKYLAGGIAAWKQAGLPLAKAKSTKKTKAKDKTKSKPQSKNVANNALKTVIYSKTTCPYCDRAKDLLQAKNVSYEEILVDSDSNKLKEMLDLSKRRTVPQIFIGDHHVGGFDDLHELQQNGKLDLLLEGKKI